MLQKGTVIKSAIQSETTTLHRIFRYSYSALLHSIRLRFTHSSSSALYILLCNDKPPVLSFMCGMNHNDARFQLHMQCICICSCTHPVFSFMCNMRHNDGSFQLCTQHISTVANCKYSTLILQKCFMKECSAMQILHNFNASRQLWIRNRELTCL